MNIVTESFSPRRLSATGTVCDTAGVLGGIFCASGAPTISVFDSKLGATTIPIVDPFSPAAGTFTPLPFEFRHGLYIVITGTGAITVGVRPV